MPGKWKAEGPTAAGASPVVYPLGDIFEHDIDSEDCDCRPFWDNGVLVHRSFDRREANEPPENPS
jgi:hypothetical protein